ncbi:MAG: hypothetical protein CEE38_11475 [Planctomycetes bacterium B3_Pla]|nr:MAG: hypothetical protein CEE38_11475 [Planctomycetes bacterium B3_Pla]
MLRGTSQESRQVRIDDCSFPAPADLWAYAIGCTGIMQEIFEVLQCGDGLAFILQAGDFLMIEIYSRFPCIARAAMLQSATQTTG